RMLAFTIAGIERDEADIHAVLNMSDESIAVELPALPGRFWHLTVNTADPSPDDVIELSRQRVVPALAYRVSPRSVVVLEAHSSARLNTKESR
ncbi:MAG: hypothetical protein FWD04_10675, partial [Conexibacteraceae bacterium]|nr:hypothetical protein [Conexibacteraceae bacterium]